MDNRLNEQRTERIIEGLIEVAKGDYSVQIKLSEENNEFDAIALGINMMIDSIRISSNEIKSLNEELLKINADKDKFFSIIAHDLKSPFNSIIGFSEILQEQISQKDYHQIDKYSEIILRSSKRAMNLLTNLMEWSQFKNGKIEFNPENFEMIDIINEVVLLNFAITKLKRITIDLLLPPNIPVSADKNMILTVLRNLISNAIKFSHPEGKIVISTEFKQDNLIVSVSDNGVGITNDRIEKLFKIGEVESTSGTQNEKGTGLGIILCKEFIEIHNGEIWVESEVDKGSTFKFSIPNTFIIEHTK